MTERDGAEAAAIVARRYAESGAARMAAHYVARSMSLQARASLASINDESEDMRRLDRAMARAHGMRGRMAR